MNNKITKEIGDRIIFDYQNGKSIKNIAIENNLHRESVRRFLNKSSIPIFKGILPYNIKIENDLRQLIIGSLLGDGSFLSVGSRTKNMCLSIAHSDKQKEYIEYKYNILKKYNLVSSLYKYTINNKRYSHILTGYKIITRVHPIFTNIRKNYYDSYGHKRVYKEFVQDIDALGLAIWYMDDGYVTNNSCILSTCSFTIDEQLLLANILLEKFNLHFTVGKNDNSMYLTTKDFYKFTQIIKDYIIPSMQYKLIPYNKREVLTKQGELLENPEVDNQQPSIFSNDYEGSETNSRFLMCNGKESNADTSALHQKQ